MNEEAPRILVVDDEPGIREGCRKILTSEGYSVTTAEDGPAALEAFEQQGNFAAALIDLRMPGMNGLELIRQLGQQDEDIVLFVITAYADINSAVQATKLGAYDYIPKPFTPDELLMAVGNGLERRALALEARRLRHDREQRMLEVAFERSKSHTIIDCMADGVIVVNQERQIVLRNAAADRMLSTLHGVQLPAPLEGALDCPELESVLDRALSAKSVPTIASAEVSRGESAYMVNASPVLDEGGEVLGATAIVRDITALKELETAKSMFVSMMAHEVKGPLAAIEGYLSTILSGAAGQDQERDRRMMQRCLLRAQTLRTMVSELMELMAIQTGKLTLERTPTNLAQLAAKAAESSRDKAAEKNIRLSTECEKDAERQEVLADQRAMQCVLTNLIDNAIKYTPENGRVDVRTTCDDGYVTVSVADNGIGMTADEAQRAFEEFYRASNAYTARILGTGLGLAIVKRLVDMHQGKVGLKSNVGEGTQFTVSIPRMQQSGASAVDG